MLCSELQSMRNTTARMNHTNIATISYWTWDRLEERDLGPDLLQGSSDGRVRLFFSRTNLTLPKKSLMKVSLNPFGVYATLCASQYCFHAALWSRLALWNDLSRCKSSSREGPGSEHRGQSPSSTCCRLSPCTTLMEAARLQESVSTTRNACRPERAV